MARRGYVPLYMKQKKYLTMLYKQRQVTSVDEMYPAEWEMLCKMHDTETLYQDANRFLSDLHFEDKCKKPW